MKRYKIDLSEYTVEVAINKRNEKTKQVESVIESVPYPIKEHLSSWLCLEGVFTGGMECCAAYDLSKQIVAAGDEIVVDEKEIGLIRKAMDALISQKPDPARGVKPLGGKVHETCIRRVFQCEEIV